MHFCLKYIFLTLTFIKISLGFPLEFNVSGTYHSRRSQALRRTSMPLGNERDLIYTTKITLGDSDQVYTVVLDSGSHDFWVTPLDKNSVRNSNDTGRKAEIGYVDSQDGIEGSVKTADLTFAGHRIPAQSFIEISESKKPKNSKGIIGLRLDQIGSATVALRDVVAGYSPLQRIFTQKTKHVPHIVTMLLGRATDPTDNNPGVFTVGSVLEEYKTIEDQPKLQANPRAHYKFLMDEYSIKVEENFIEANTTMEVDDMADMKKLTALVDSGFSFNQVPESVAKEIYTTYPNTEKITVPGLGDVWLVPCKEEVRIVFRLGGKEIPIHPLDATFDPSQSEQAGSMMTNGQKMCIGTFQPISFDTQEMDIVLGAAFLRNVYALTNFGEDVSKPSNDGRGYMQLLGTTNPKRASEDFRKVRCGGQACK